MSTNKTLGSDGLGELIDILKTELANAVSSVPTITIALSQVVGQSPLQIQLTNEQYDALSASQVAVIDATAVGVGALATIVRYGEDSTMLWFQGHSIYISDDYDIEYENKYSFWLNKSTRIITQYVGNFIAGIYIDTSSWTPGTGRDYPVTSTFIREVFATRYASTYGITSGSTLSDTVIRDYITCHLPISINGALCHYMGENALTDTVRYFTATMNGALVHLNIIEINTSTWVVTFNQVDVGASPNVDQDLTANTCFTLDATAYASLVSTHTATVASPVFTGLSNAYEFVTIKVTVYTSPNTSTNYNIKLSRNETYKYSGLFFIEDSSHLYELTLYYNGTSVYLRCATVY